MAKSTEEEQNALLFYARVARVSVPVEDTVSLALDMRLSNEQTRKLRLWRKKWHVHLASEGRYRFHVKETMGEVDISSELVQTVSLEEEGHCTLKPAAFARVKNPLTLVIQHLAHLAERNALTWHERNGNCLPKNELWLKFGGDRGGGSFKFCFQVVNRASPNSADHTVVISCLMMASDSLTSMHLAMDPFQAVIEDLNGMQWR